MKPNRLLSIVRRLFLLVIPLFLLVRQLFLLVKKFSVTAKSSSLIGTWERSAAGSYIMASHTVTLEADGRYQMSDSSYSQMGVTWFKHSGTYEIQNDRIVFKPEKWDGCPGSNPPPKTLTFLWKFHNYNDGKKLRLLSSTDPQNWANADTFSRQK